MPDAHNQRSLAQPRYVLPGFTLIELLIVIAILGILAAIVLTAINPGAQLAAVQNAKRKAYIYTQGMAITQHVIGMGRPPAADIPVGALMSKAVCRRGITNASCVNMDALVPTFIADLPTDPAETNNLFTGYEVYQDNGSRYFVCSDYLPNGDAGRCGNSTYTASEAEGGDGGDVGGDGGDTGGDDGGSGGDVGGGGGDDDLAYTLADMQATCTVNTGNSCNITANIAWVSGSPSLETSGNSVVFQLPTGLTYGYLDTYCNAVTSGGRTTCSAGTNDLISWSCSSIGGNQIRCFPPQPIDFVGGGDLDLSLYVAGDDSAASNVDVTITGPGDDNASNDTDTASVPVTGGGGGGFSCGGTTPITTCTDLQNMSANGSYYLANDIDCSATTGWNSGAGFSPIAGNFTGAVDGNGHTISSLYINRPGTSYVGLFSTISTGCVAGVNMTGINYTTAGDTGGIAGSMNGAGSVTDVSVTGTISTNGIGGRVGGIAGEITHGAVVRRSWTNTNITTVVTAQMNGGAGGLSGSVSSNGYVYDSYARGSVNVTGSKAAGLVGFLYSTAGDAVIENSYATGNIQANMGTSGVANDGGWGWPQVTNVFYDSQTTGQSDSAGGYTPKTTAQMRQQATFSGWDFTNVWQINEGSSYPTLR